MKLETLFAKASKVQSEIKSRVLRINAHFASNCLKDFNDSNRPMSQSVAKLYANEMLRGQWQCNGEPLIFSVDSTGKEHLISGQHRLQGLLLANQAIELGQEWPSAQTEWDSVVVYNVPHETADTVDTGKARSHSDVLFRDPWVDSFIPSQWNETINARKTWTKTLAGAARLVWLIEGGATVSSAPKFLISEMLNFIQQRHSNLHQFVTMVLDANDADADNHGLKMSLPYIAALAYVASVVETEDGLEVDKSIADTMDQFINQLAVGTGFDKGDPAWALTGFWNKLTSEPGSKDRDRDWVGPFIKAARHVLEGSTNLKVSDVALTKKERDQYTQMPIMFDGFQTQCFERAAAAIAIAAEASISPPEIDDAPAESEPEPEVKKRKAPAKRKPSPVESAV